MDFVFKMCNFAYFFARLLIMATFLVSSWGKTRKGDLFFLSQNDEIETDTSNDIFNRIWLFADIYILYIE